MCYTDTDSFIFLVKTNSFYKDSINDIQKWFDTSAYSKDIDRPLPKGINKKVIGKFKDELAGQIISELCILRAECYSFKLDNDNEKKAKGIKQCVIKRQLTFDNYVDALFNDNKITRSQYVFRRYCHQVYTEKVTKIALSGNNDKRIQATDKIATYPYGCSDKDNNNSTHLNISNDDGFDKLIERVKALNKRLDTRLNNILNEKSKQYRKKRDKCVSNDNKVHIEFYENFNKRLDAIKVGIENLQKPVVNKYINDTELIKKSKAKREKLNKYSSDITEFIEYLTEVMENAKRLNNIKIYMKNLEVLLQGVVIILIVMYLLRILMKRLTYV